MEYWMLLTSTIVHLKIKTDDKSTSMCSHINREYRMMTGLSGILRY